MSVLKQLWLRSLLALTVWWVLIAAAHVLGIL